MLSIGLFAQSGKVNKNSSDVIFLMLSQYSLAACSVAFALCFSDHFTLSESFPDCMWCTAYACAAVTGPLANFPPLMVDIEPPAMATMVTSAKLLSLAANSMAGEVILVMRRLQE